MGNTPAKSSRRYSTSTGSNIKKIQLGGTGLPAPPGKPVLIPASSEDPQPDIVGIRWERSPSNGGSAIIGYLVEHRRLGSPHWVRSSPNLCPFPELTLSGLEPGWRYQFRVRAQNSIGFSRPSELSDPLTVTLQRSAATTPKFELELKDTIALENEQAEFVIKFSGTPVPKISWFKDGFEIFSSRRTRIVTENGKSILLIHQTALNDEGEIKCTATNRAGHVSTRAKLVLEAYPRIRLPRQYEDGLLFEQDETIRLKVSVAGKPLPTVAWFHDGEVINSDERHVIEALDSGECSMKIPAARRQDRGEYTVRAVNKLGEDIASFLVTVTDRPSAPGKATIAMTLGRSVTLSWKEPNDDGGCKIGTYIVEYYRIGWDVWLKAATCRQPTTTLSELIEGSEYKFRVKAENPYGVSDPSDESDVIFIPDPRRGIHSPPLKPDKSQSQREIHRGRSEKREQPQSSKRTRSLTREEATRNNNCDDFVTPPSRSVSVHKLTPQAPPKPPRTDSRVTFADIVFLHVEKPLEDIAPVPPARPKSKRDKHQNLNNDEDIKKENVEEKTSSVTTIIRQPYFDDTGGLQRPIKVKSPSPMPSSIIQVQQPSIDEPKRTRSSLPREQSIGDDDFRGSSEFMLLLYPDREDGVKYPLMRSASDGDAEDDEDLVPPPMSLSLPELFSVDHQVVEILREAVSSTELLHERAMERFYKAVAVEEAEAAKKNDSSAPDKQKDGLDFLSGKLRNTRLKRRLSSGSPTSGVNIKWNRRRSSESQASPQLPQDNITDSIPPVPELIVSDPNLHKDFNNHEENFPMQNFAIISSSLGLHRWDNKSMPLVPEITPEKQPRSKHYRDVKTPDREIVEELVIANDYEESTDEGSESEGTDSEDLKTLKSRLLAQSTLDEEDTYHPRGRPIAYTPSPEPDYKISMENSIQNRISPSPGNNIQPKSILKKRTEAEPVALNHFGRPVPPEQPILERQTNTNTLKNEEIASFEPPVTLRKKLLTESPDVSKPIISEINNDNASLVNAAEVAKSRRRPSLKPELEKKSSVEEKEDLEGKMAVVDHYTEIVKEYATSHMAFPPRFKPSTAQTQHKMNLDQKDPEIFISQTKQTDEISLAKKSIEPNFEKPSTSSRDTTPSGTTMIQSSRRNSSNESPSSGSRNVSVEKKLRSSSKTRSREPSQDREGSRLPSRIKRREISRDRESPASRSSSRQRKDISRQSRSSRANSKERFKSFDINPSDSETSQRITRQKENHYLRPERSRRSSLKTFDRLEGRNGSEGSNRINEELIAEAKVKVRSTMSYTVDLIILIAAMYVYLFKKEILAIPLICLLLYRRIQEDIDKWMPKWWRSQPKKG